jgi:hypothetical protein
MSEFWDFFRQVLILLIIISIYFPLNVPIAALAYKVRIGAHPIPFSQLAYWGRSIIAALGMAFLSISLMGFDKVLFEAGVPAGLVHMSMFICFVPLGAWWMSKAFALEDGWEGLSTLLLFVFLPGLVLVVVKLVTGLMPPYFIDVEDWIAKVPTT